MESIDDAVLDVLTAGPKSSNPLVAEITETFRRATNKTVTRSSVMSRLSRLLHSNAIVLQGADEQGAIYALPPKEEEEDDEEEEGGDGQNRVIN
jgi:hypothetical protein